MKRPVSNVQKLYKNQQLEELKDAKLSEFHNAELYVSCFNYHNLRGWLNNWKIKQTSLYT